MSGLAGLLAHHVEPGIYRWHGHFPVEDVRHTVEHAGWKFAAVDGWHHTTKAEFLEAIGEALDFPDYYGKNFDALADCLGDVEGAVPAVDPRLDVMRQQPGESAHLVILSNDA
jgi:hypothetical protein